MRFKRIKINVNPKPLVCINPFSSNQIQPSVWPVSYDVLKCRERFQSHHTNVFILRLFIPFDPLNVKFASPVFSVLTGLVSQRTKVQNVNMMHIYYLSSEWQTTTLRLLFSPTEKVVSFGRSSTWLWIRYRSLLGRGGNRSTLDRQRQSCPFDDIEATSTEKLCISLYTYCLRLLFFWYVSNSSMTCCRNWHSCFGR